MFRVTNHGGQIQLSASEVQNPPSEIQISPPEVQNAVLQKTITLKILNNNNKAPVTGLYY